MKIIIRKKHKKINESVYLDKERYEKAANAEKDAIKDAKKIVDVSLVTYMPVYNSYTGELVCIVNPKKLALTTSYIINCMRQDRTSRFMAPYLEQKIIWSNEAGTAFTNGVRIAISPIFGHSMIEVKGQAYLHSEEVVSNIAWLVENEDADEAIERNMALGLYIRFVITHEIYHMVYLHIRRTIIHIADPSDPELHYIANVALDLEINRDIVGRWPEFEKPVTECGFLWIYDPLFLNKETGLPFLTETWEDIYDYLIKHRDQVPPHDQLPKSNDPKEQNGQSGQDGLNGNNNLPNLPNGFSDGWELAFKDVKNGKFKIKDIKNGLPWLK